MLEAIGLGGDGECRAPADGAAGDRQAGQVRAGRRASCCLGPGAGTAGRKARAISRRALVWMTTRLRDAVRRLLSEAYDRPRMAMSTGHFECENLSDRADVIGYIADDDCGRLNRNEMASKGVDELDQIARSGRRLRAMPTIASALTPPSSAASNTTPAPSTRPSCWPKSPTRKARSCASARSAAAAAMTGWCRASAASRCRRRASPSASPG